MKKGAFDFPDFDDEIILKSGGLDSLIWLQNVRDRKLWWTDNVDETVIDNLVAPIMKFNAEDKDKSVEERKPIIIYCSSPGGDVDSGFAVIDVILASKTPVWTVNLGEHYSMAFLIGLAGHKRFAMPNAKFLMHDGSSAIWDSGAKVQDRAEFNKRVEARIKEYVLRRTNVTSREYDKRYRTEWFLFADEAKKYGMVDCIIGEDCELDEVI